MTTPRPRPTAPRRALYGLGIAALSLLLVEGVVRLVVPTRALQFQWEQPDGLLALTEELHAQVPPEVQREFMDGPYPWRVRTNAQGLREDAEIPAAIPLGERRILAVGDSWIYGWSVDQGHTIPDLLEGLLPQRLGVERVQVVNGGVPYASTLDMLLRWRELRATLDLDGVLLGTSHNTMQLHLQRDRRALAHAPSLGAPPSPVRSYMLLRRLLARWTRPASGHPSTEGPGPAIRDMMREDMARLVSEIQAEGLDLWFLQMPATLDQPAPLKRTWAPFVPALRSLGVPMAGHSLEQRSCWGYEDLGHPSAAGAAALAAVAAELIATGATQATIDAQPSCDGLPAGASSAQGASDGG